MIDIVINENNKYLTTSGLMKAFGYEFQISIGINTIKDCKRVLTYLVNYVNESKPTIREEQTISYHSWILKFVNVGNSIYNIWEAKNNGEGFVEGASYAIEIINQQEEECVKNNASPRFPTFSQKIVISKGVLEGLPVSAVRYPSPDHLTGWWLTTDLYDDNVNSLETIYYFNLAFKRPDILRYLALPFGYRFYHGQGKDIWFDKKVLES